MIPEFRTTKFAIWRACERFGVRPPGVRDKWEDCSSVTQAELLAFDQLSQHDEITLASKLGVPRV